MNLNHLIKNFFKLSAVALGKDDGGGAWGDPGAAHWGK